jgi:predicted 2-oxoglutarate/Fe(II)-dependent dioxygenase YbiX
MRRSFLVIVAIVVLCVLYRPKYHQPRVYKNLFSPETCDHIRNLASDILLPSTVSEDREVDTSIRKSKTAWLDPRKDDIVRQVIKTCASLTDRPPKNCEQLQVLKYKPGGFYTEHQDAFDKDIEQNYRLYTCIIGLNEEYEGGETNFPNIKKKYRLNKGDVLVFNTLNDWDCFTDDAIHAGLPVRSGEKWICNLWIHKHVFGS